MPHPLKHRHNEMMRRVVEVVRKGRQCGRGGVDGESDLESVIRRLGDRKDR